MTYITAKHIAPERPNLFHRKQHPELLGRLGCRRRGEQTVAPPWKLSFTLILVCSSSSQKLVFFHKNYRGLDTSRLLLFFAQTRRQIEVRRSRAAYSTGVAIQRNKLCCQARVEELGATYQQTEDDAIQAVACTSIVAMAHRMR